MKKIAIILVIISLFMGNQLLAQTNKNNEGDTSDKVKIIKKFQAKKPIMDVESQNKKFDEKLEVKNGQYKTQNLKQQNMQVRELEKPVKVLRKKPKIKPALLQSFKEESFVNTNLKLSHSTG